VRGKYPGSVSQEVSSKNERDSQSRETDVVKKVARNSSWYVSSHLSLIVKSRVKFAFALGLSTQVAQC
jgi:hypothetical protein